MSKAKVLLLGATGETGASILEGLAADGSFDISIAVRPASMEKPTVRSLASRGFPIISVDLTSEVNPALLQPFSTVISCVGPESQRSQLNLATAAKAAKIQRFVPCGFTTVCPPGGIMQLRDEKEEVYNHVFQLHLPYTIIDVGFWHQLSFPLLPSGRLDKFHFMPANDIYDDGNAPNLLTDLRDIGKWVARIVKDPRTLNQKVFAWSDELSQNSLFALVERLSGEKVDSKPIPASETESLVAHARQALEEGNPNDIMLQVGVWTQEYRLSKYVRRDNTRENAIYLGYLDARELYPEFRPITFEECFKEILGGKGSRPYAQKW